MAWTNDVDEVTVSQSGGLSEETLRTLETVASALGVEPTIVQSGTIRMTAVRREGVVVQSFDPGFAVPMSFSVIDPTTAAPLVGDRVASAVGAGLVMTETTARLRGSEVGDVVTLEAWAGGTFDFPIAAVLPDAEGSWNELVMSVETAVSLGIDRPSSAVFWGVNTTLVDLLVRTSLPDAPISVSGPGSEREPFLDWVLPMPLIKERFGEFSFREMAGDRIYTDDVWYDANIVTVTLPTLGQFRCHRAIMPYVQGALAEIEVRGLAPVIDGGDFQIAGGCYNARLARGGDLDRGFAVSRHSWGIAIDFNPSTNRFGDETTLPEEFGQVFRDWGFAWGAGWRVSDPMHFEWREEVSDPARVGCLQRIGEAIEPVPTVLCFP